MNDNQLLRNHLKTLKFIKISLQEETLAIRIKFIMNSVIDHKIKTNYKTDNKTLNSITSKRTNALNKINKIRHHNWYWKEIK